jgi:hypothetical protein
VTETALEERLSAPLAEFLADRIPKAAKRAHGRYPDVPKADFEQAMWERAVRKSQYLRKMFDEGRLGVVWAELCREGTRVGKADERVRRADSAALAGYSVYDIEFYSTGMLAKLLPALVEADFDVSAAMDRASSSTDAAGIHIRSSDPFGGAENYLVVLVDLTAAYGRLPEGMRRLLKTYYGVDQEETQDGRWAREGLAASMGLTSESLRQRVHRALQRLQDELGGPDPWMASTDQA